MLRYISYNNMLWFILKIYILFGYIDILQLCYKIIKVLTGSILIMYNKYMNILGFYVKF